MGKAAKWFRSLLSSKNNNNSPAVSTENKKKKKKKKGSKWAVWKREDGLSNKIVIKNGSDDGSSNIDANRHAVAVAAATAAVAEAALAAAQAAAEVVRLTSSGTSYAGINGERLRVVAAVKIQSAFRAYLARRALRALKGLVKLQALVRGHIVRKQGADMLRRMQAMARIQARATAHRSYATESSNTQIKYPNSCRPGAVNPRKYDRPIIVAPGSPLKQRNSKSHFSDNVNKGSPQLRPNLLYSWMEQCVHNNGQNTSLGPQRSDGDDERSDKILEIDTWKPRQSSRRDKTTSSVSDYFSAWNDSGRDYLRTGSPSRLSAKLQNPNPSISSTEVSSIVSLRFQPKGDLVMGWTAETSPGVRSATSGRTSNVRGPFTPTRSECSRSLLGDYLGYPNYMANTESSRAKVRSQSAPKHRMPLEELGRSLNFDRGVWQSDTNSETGLTRPANYRSNPYIHSGQSKRQGSPTYDAANSFSSKWSYRL